MENKIYEYAKSSSFQKNEEDVQRSSNVSKESNPMIDKLYNTYFIYDYRNDKNNTIIKMFMEDNKLTLNNKKTYYHHWINRISVYLR